MSETMNASATIAEPGVRKETLVVGGKPTPFDAHRIGGQTFIVSGSLLRIASLKNEWWEDLHDPVQALAAFRRASRRPDILRFWQRLPDGEPRHSFYHETIDIAAIPVTTYDHWWNTQINGKTRNMVRKGQKLGVSIREVPFDDTLVRGIMGIFNEAPVRRGKPFWHYRKPFEAVKAEMGLDLDDSLFIGAYHQEQLIGFIKLLLTDRYAMVTMILDKMSEREKAVTNGMIAKAVEICAARGVPFLTYTHWRRGEHGEFQKRNGFEKHPVPQYFIPLTLKGRMAIACRLHHGWRALLPDRVFETLLAVRARCYAWKFRHEFAHR